MAYQERYKPLSLEDKKKRREARKSPISPQRSFYETKDGEGSRFNERIEGAVNRRAVGLYVDGF